MVKLSFAEETKKEVEEIKRELASHPELEKVSVTPQLDHRMKKAFESITEKKKENISRSGSYLQNGACLTEMIEKKDIKYKLRNYDKLLEQINHRIADIQKEISKTKEQMYEIAAYPDTLLDKEGHGSTKHDLMDVLSRYEKMVKEWENELVSEVSTLTEEYRLINRLYLCFQALSGMDYEIIDKLYRRGMPYKAVEQESGLSHSSFEQRRQGALKLISMLCTSEKSNEQIIRYSRRKEEQHVLNFSTQEKWIDDYVQMTLDDIQIN